MTRETVAVPPTYDDGPNARADLLEAAHLQFPHLDLQVVEVAPAADRPGWQVVTLEDSGAPETWPVDADVVEDWDAKDAAVVLERALVRQGARLARFDPVNRIARAMWADTFDAGLRDKVSAFYGVGGTPWEVEVRVHHAADGNPDRYTVTRAPAGRDATAGLYTLPGVDPWWMLTENSWHGTVTLEYVPKPELPAIVPLDDLLPDLVTSEDWNRLPLGLDANGEVVSLDLTLGPHALLVGPPGSGKSVGVTTLTASALLRGFEVVVVVDPSKGSTDYRPLAPWVSAWGVETMAEVRDTLQAVYAEGERRRKLLRREGAVKWDDLSPAVRRREGVRPILLIVDEASSLFLMPATKTINGLERDSPERTEMEQLVADKAMTHYIVSKLAREMRYVGIHLIVATQRPEAESIGGELRSLLSSRCQLSPPHAPPSQTDIGMVFSKEHVESAHEQIQTLSDGRSRGLAVVAGEGGLARGLRVAYAPVTDVPALLEARGVPHATPWGTAAMADTVDEQLEAEVIDHGVVPVTWDPDAFTTPTADEPEEYNLGLDLPDFPNDNEEPAW